MKVRHQRFRWATVWLWCALASSTLVFVASLQAQAAPAITILSPADGATVEKSVTIQIAHTGIRFDGIRIGYEPEPGAGHWHINVDGKYAGLSVSNVIELPNDSYPVISAGRHTISVSLQQNNHAPLTPAVTQSINLNFAEEVRLPTRPADQPNLRIVEPRQPVVNIEAPLVVQVEHSGFRLDGLKSGKNPEPNTGHWHINIDGRYAGLSVSGVLEIPNDSYPTIAPGQHTVTVYLHQNNHAAVDPPVSQTFQINASAEINANTSAPVVTATVAATTTSAGATSTAAPDTTTTPSPNTTATPDSTATGATVGADGTVVAGGGSIPSIPNTGQESAHLTPTFLTAIISMVLGSMLMYLSRMGRVPVVAGSGGNLQPSAGFGRAALPVFGKGWTPRGGWREFLFPRSMLSLSTALGFMAGGFFGLGIAALVYGLTSVSTPMVAQAPAKAEPVMISVQAVPQTAATVIAAPIITAPAVADARASRPVSSLLGSLPWPAYIPVGMTLSPADSWPFQVLSQEQSRTPFLVFRDHARWLVFRHQGSDAQASIAGASRQEIDVGGAAGFLVTYPDKAMTLTWERDGQRLQISAAGVPVGELMRVATAAQPRSTIDLRDRLNQAAAHQQLNVTTLWPAFLPAGMELVHSETVAEFTEDSRDQYQLTFRKGAARVWIGGGATALPPLSGKREQIRVGNRVGQLTSSATGFRLVVEANTGEAGPQLAFTPATSASAPHLPLVQHGRVFVAADHLDRATFDRVVAGLLPLRPQEFVARANGQNTSAVGYRWPVTLPDDFSVDPTTIRASWDDYLLQGGRPFFALTARGPKDATLTIDGGSEAFVLPEGAEVEQVPVTVRGQGATAARTPEGTLVVWTEQGTFYRVSSSTLDIGALVQVADALQPLTAAAFAQRAR